MKLKLEEKEKKKKIVDKKRLKKGGAGGNETEKGIDDFHRKEDRGKREREKGARDEGE